MIPSQCLLCQPPLWIPDLKIQPPTWQPHIPHPVGCSMHNMSKTELLNSPNSPQYPTILPKYPTYPLKMSKSSQLLGPKPRSHLWLFFFCTYTIHQQIHQHSYQLNPITSHPLHCPHLCASHNSFSLLHFCMSAIQQAKLPFQQPKSAPHLTHSNWFSITNKIQTHLLCFTRPHPINKVWTINHISLAHYDPR